MSIWKYLALACALWGCGRRGFDPLTASTDGGDGDGASSMDAPPGSGRHFLKAPSPHDGDLFGHRTELSADGTTLVVSAFFDDSAATGVGGDPDDRTAPNSGAVHVFRRVAGLWAHEAYLKASNTEAGDDFGWGLALSDDGTTIAVGAVLESSAAVGIDGSQVSNAEQGAGAVYVFTRSGATWTQQAYVKASNTGAGDEFGFSVALSADGNTLAVGARGEDSIATGVGGIQADEGATAAGAVYVFTRTGATWSQQEYLKASNTSALDTFGIAVSLSADGNTLVATAPGEDSNASGVGGVQANESATNAGAAYVFVRAGMVWTQQAYLKATVSGSGALFGTSAALDASGDRLAIGARTENTGLGTSGAAFTYTRADTTWMAIQRLKASSLGIADELGTSLALASDGTKLVVGAPNEDGGGTGLTGDPMDDSVQDSGAAYVMVESAGSWQQTGYFKASNTGMGDAFAVATAISGDGRVIACGASGEDSASATAPDEATPQAGAVYVFD